jgi:putative membrane protein insertion efficiency factor
MQQVLISFIKLYQRTLSYVIGGGCRFYPTCSSYAIQAIKQHGSWRGSLMAIKRISRCHPLNPGGIDEVPKSDVQACSACHQKHSIIKEN